MKKTPITVLFRDDQLHIVRESHRISRIKMLEKKMEDIPFSKFLAVCAVLGSSQYLDEANNLE